MTDLTIIDQFLDSFIRYIDSGFGLLGPDVAFLTTALIGIDITLAGLFWAMGDETDVIGRFVRKILYVGSFAFILNRFPLLADLIFRSFAAAGLTAGGGTLSAEALMKPGFLAGTGFAAAWPLLDQVSDLMGVTSFFDNFLMIAVLLFAWALVILAFFILAVQMFVCIVEFKLTALAGFVLVPFALWNRTGFLAERVLGNVVSSGIKVMMLAVIVGIGTSLFAEMSQTPSSEPDIAQALSLVLASLALFGLGIFAPSLAAGLVAGAPQLGAGAALGTSLGAIGISAAGGAATMTVARATGSAALGAIHAGASMGTAASLAYQLGQSGAGAGSKAAGLGGIARAASASVRHSLSARLGVGPASRAQRRAAAADRDHAAEGAQQTGEANPAPAWAQNLARQQTARHRRQVVLQSLKEGDHGSMSATPDLKEKDE